jgi:hypothetical protein
MLGVLPNGQVAEATLLTGAAVQASLPEAVTVAVTVQPLAGAVKLELKLADAPGARLGTVNTVLGEDCALTTVTLFKVTLPLLLTEPV